MSEFSLSPSKLAPEQEAIRDRCFHPSGMFVEFAKEDVETSIPERFEKIVQRYPNRLAVKVGHRALTYEELNRAANRIAHGIVEARGTESEPIALLFENGIDAIAAIFGVLKAGKFYVALNPSVPAERNAAIVADCQPGMIVSNGSGTNLAEKYCAEKVALLNVDKIADRVFAGATKLNLSTETAAILVYTSGSTGAPKAVIEPHRNVLHSVMVQTHSRRITAADKLTLLHSLSFGSSKVQLFTALLNGASLLPFDLRTNGIEQLVRWLKEEEITIYHSPPAVFRQLAQALSAKEQLSSLRMMYLSGVGATRADLDLSKKHFGAHTRLEMGMGSTETNQITLCLAGQNTPFPKNGTPAGYPVSGKQLFILDESRRVLPPGEIGEIAVRSGYLSTGYWQKPELTREKFLSDPKGGDERTYLTGDLGRMLPDGFLIHMGRKDLMVKVRGFRVEIAEVERALLSHPLIEDAAVAAWDRAPVEKYLVGYVVTLRRPAITVSELRVFLATRLPDYMIPSTFVFLESLPLTNGKVDRRALPAPDHVRAELATRYVAARTDEERQLVEIWEEILEVRPIGVDDSFFDLGGHSLSATQVVARARSVFRVEISVRRLLEAPTVASLAKAIETIQWLQNCQQPDAESEGHDQETGEL